MHRRTLLLLGFALTALSGCIDIRNFEGVWQGKVVVEPEVRQGFTNDVAVDSLVLANIDLQELSASLTTSDGKFSSTPLTKVRKFSNDAMADLSFNSAALRSYLLFAPLATEEEGWPAMLLISLFSDEHVELRVVRGNDLFGVFHLQRKMP